MLVLGLTGGIGSGKSTVAAQLVARGAQLIDADSLVRAVQAPGEPVFAAMVERFGPGVVAPDGTLDRQAVADIVFKDEAALADLNAIVHPAVGAELERRLTHALSGEESEGFLVLDIPLLVPAGGSRSSAETPKRPWDVDGVIVVDTDPEVAVARLVEQREFSEDDARARLAQQASREDRLAVADFVVGNDGTPAELAAEVDRCWAWMEGLAEEQAQGTSQP